MERPQTVVINVAGVIRYCRSRCVLSAFSSSWCCGSKWLWTKKGGIGAAVHRRALRSASRCSTRTSATIVDQAGQRARSSCMIFLVGFFIWFAMRQAVDERHRGSPRGCRTFEATEVERQKSSPGPTWSTRSSICMVAADGRAGRLGRSSSRRRSRSRPTRPRAQPVEGAVVLPRPPGDAGLLRPLDGRRRAARA